MEYGRSSQVRWPRGNDLTTIHEIDAIDQKTGKPLEGFSLYEVTSLEVASVRDMSKTAVKTYDIVSEHQLSIRWDGAEQKVGTYSVEIKGEWNGIKWRIYNSRKYTFQIVESNEQACIPPENFIGDGCILMQERVALLYGTQANWAQESADKPDFIKNKPTIPDELADLASDSTHRLVTDSEKASWNAKYRKPSGGIPPSDLSSSVQTSLGKADTALQNETDPTVPAWAKQPTKPSYTASEVGALPDTTPIPDELKDLSDDTTHRLVTDTEKSAWNGKYSKPNDGIPSTDLASGVIPDVSQFITKSVNDLVNYYTKSQTYTQAEVQQLINAVKQFTYESVSTLPTASSSTMNKIYLVPSSDPQTQNVKDEYITIESSGSYSWELIGNTSVDLSGYVTTTALNTALADYVTSTSLSSILAGYQTKIDSAHKLDYSLLDNTPTIPDVSGKADKVSNATNGNLASLDANGNLTDSGKSVEDFLQIGRPLQPTLFTSEDSKNLYIEPIMDTLWAANKRFTTSLVIKDANNNIVTSNDGAKLFNGDYGQAGYAIEDGYTCTITISTSDPDTKYLEIYTQGHLIVNFYYNGIPASITGRVYRGSTYKDWTNINFTKQIGEKNNTYYTPSVPSPYASVIELTIVGQSVTADPHKTALSSIEWWNIRAKVGMYPFVNKYGAETLYYLLTANGGISIPSGKTVTIGGKAVLTDHQDISNLVPNTRTVNGKALSADITLSASDVNALPSSTVIPDAQIQSDWEQTVTTAKDYIKNKPTIPAAQVNSDWNASSGVAQILNKPTIPTITFRQW